MPLDIKKVKERLQKLQSKGSGEKIDYKKLFFKPQLGKQTVRIVPNKFSKDFPFTEVIFHNQNVFKKSIYSLENWGDKDPIMQLRKELFSDDDPETKEVSEETAKKLSPRTKAYAQVIVRGREAEGVLLWEMNKTTYESVLNLVSQEDEYGDITDIMEGTDLVVEGYNDTVKIGKKTVEYVAVNVTPKRKTSALSDNASEVEKWLEEQKNPLELYKKLSYDEIKELLYKWMNPDDSTDSDDDTEDEKPVVKSTSKVSKNVNDDDDDDEDKADEEDDVPPVKKTISKPTTKKSKVTVDEDDDADEEDDDDVPQKKSGASEVIKGGVKKTSKQKIAEMFDEDDD